MTSLIARVTGVASVDASDLRCHTVALTAGHLVSSVFQQGREGKVQYYFFFCNNNSLFDIRQVQEQVPREQLELYMEMFQMFDK